MVKHPVVDKRDWSRIRQCTDGQNKSLPLQACGMIVVPLRGNFRGPWPSSQIAQLFLERGRLGEHGLGGHAEVALTVALTLALTLALTAALTMRSLTDSTGEV